MAKSDDRITELEEALKDAEDRAKRANVRARDADESYRKLQLDVVNAKDDLATARQRIEALEKELGAAHAAAQSAAKAPTKPPTKPPPREREAELATQTEANAALHSQVEKMLKRIASLRELLAAASIELSQLHADEVALGKKRTRVLTDACTLLARAVGESGEAPPPIPTSFPTSVTSLEARLSMSPSVDISEVAELIESLRPPGTPKLD